MTVALLALLLGLGHTGLTPAAHASTVGHPSTFAAPVQYGVGGGPNLFGLATADVNGDGIPDIVETNASDHTVSVLLGNGDGTFQAKQDFPTGSYPTGVAVADMNGDGIPDIVTANYADNSVSVLLGNGDGTFGAPLDGGFPTRVDPEAIAVADLNGDGIPDVVVSSPGGNSISVLLGNGDGTLGSSDDINSGQFTVGVAIADVNGDGKPDIVSVNALDSTASVFLGNGNGTFQSAVTYATDTGPDGVVLADVNGDGIPDIVTSNRSSSPTVSVLLGNGNGTFQTHQDYRTGSTPFGADQLAVSDMNGDGKPDILTANLNSDTVSLLLGNGDGSFGTAQTLDVGPGGSGNQPVSLAVADLNGDGAPDIVTGNYDTNTVSVLLQTSSHALPGTFEAPLQAAAGTDAYAVATGDFNRDGKPDVVVANNDGSTVSVLLGNGDGSYQTAQTFDTGTFPSAVAVADVNGDGKPDIVATNLFSSPNGSVSVLLGNGDGTFQTQQTFTVGNSPESVAIADVNRDGKPDIVVANAGGSSVSVLLGNGNGTFQAQQTFTVGASPYGVAVADVNGDGIPDIVTANYDTSGSVSVLLGNGSGGFQTHQDFAVGDHPRSVAIGDVNGDGKPDIVAGNYDDDSVSVLLGDGSGTTFTAQPALPVAFPPVSVAIADLNRDGKPDIVAGTAGHTVSVLLGNGNGTFGAHQDFDTGSGSSAVAVADMNVDGKPDLVTANYGTSNSVSTLIQYGKFARFAVEAPGGGPIGQQQAGMAFDVLIRAVDDTGNTVPNWSGTATVDSNRTIVGGPFTSDPFAAGSVTEQITLAAGGSGSWVSATKTGGLATGKSNRFAVLEADGAGTATVSRSWVANGVGGYSLVFKFTAAAGGMDLVDGGGVQIEVPPDWPDPSLTPTDPGYVTTSRGVVSSVSSHVIVVSGTTIPQGGSVFITYGSTSGGGLGATAPTTGGDELWAMWSQAGDGGSLQPLASSPTVTVLSPNGSGAITPSPGSVVRGSSGNSIDFAYAAGAGGTVNGDVKLHVPDGFSLPSTTPTDPGYTTASQGTVSVSGQWITVTGVTLSAGAILDIVYGDTSGTGSGATAPSTSGTRTWLAKEISNPKSGGYVALATSPSVGVTR